MKTLVIIIGIVALLLAIYFLKIVNWYYSISTSSAELFDQYDFIIVGGGTTGSVIANRLSEISDIRVLLLEAGEEDPMNFLSIIPFFTPFLQQTSVDWHYVTESQEYSSSHLKENKSFWPRGKILGGSSALNWMVYTRGSSEDFKEWVDLGATGWSYRDVLPYFKKSERLIAKDAHLNSDIHGHDGYLNVDIRKNYGVTSWFLQAGNELGYKTVDYNSEDEGFAFIQSTISRGKRHSAADAYLYPFARQRKNLHIVTRAHVTKVLFETGVSNVPRAVGVEYEKDGRFHRMKASKEVIVSSGAIGTPHLLMLSGLGPKEHLVEHGIDVVTDLPGVGSFLKDHIFATVGYSMAPEHLKGAVLQHSEVFSLSNVLSYLYNGSGIFSSPGLDAFAYIKTEGKGPKKKYDYPDFHLLLLAIQEDLTSESEINILQRAYNYKSEVLKDRAAVAAEVDKVGLSDFVLVTCMSHPKSVGSIRLKSNVYTEHPRIDPRYLSDEEDVESYLKIFRFHEKLEQTEAFKSKGIKLSLHSGVCTEGSESPRTDEYLKCLVKSTILTNYHPCCTAKMGFKDDVMAVADARLRVYKVTGLRVADASVMPELPSGNTQAPCYMIGEKAADMIKEDWKLV